MLHSLVGCLKKKIRYQESILAIYAPMIYTTPCVMFLMLEDTRTIRGQVGGGWALEIESFLGPSK